MTPLALAEAALAVPATAARGGPIDVAIVALSVLVAVYATRAVGRGVRDIRVWMLGLLWTFTAAELARVLGLALEHALVGVGYAAVAVVGVRLVATLGWHRVRPLALDSAVAGAAVAGQLFEPARFATSALDLAIVFVGVATATMWAHFVVLRRHRGRAVVALFSVAAVLMLASLAVDVVTLDGSDGGAVALIELACRVALAIAVAHPDTVGLFRRTEVSCEAVTGSRLLLAAVLLVTLGIISRVLVVGGTVPPWWKVLLPVAALLLVVRHAGRLYRSAVQDNRALRRSALRDPVSDRHNERGLAAALVEQDVAGHTLLAVELDGFRALLRRLDLDSAAELVRGVAGRLEVAIGGSPVVARCDTDEFVLLTPEDPSAVAQAVETTMGEALYLPASAVSVQVTVRMGWSSVDPSDPVAALAEARFAAGEAASGTVVAFAEEQRARYDEQRLLLREFPAALREGQLQAHYQPVLSTVSGRIEGFEVLARWTHPTLGPISPAAFIPLAESSGAIVELGERLIASACRQLAVWRRLPGHEALEVAVNLSPRQLADSDLERVVTAALAESGLPPSALALELTEGMLVDLETEGHVLRDLQALGVRVAVDDFGTGYSSMAYLAALRPDVVKVDRCFTQALTGEDPAVARGVFALLSQLELPVVAEGVEDEEMLAAVRSLGCERWQGFLHSRPMAASDATAMLAEVAAPAPARGSRATV